jgi:hypothetical protein
MRDWILGGSWKKAASKPEWQICRAALMSGSRLARAGAKSLGHLAFGLLDGGLEFGRKLQVVLDHIVQPVAHLAQFRLRKLLQFRFDLGNFGTLPKRGNDFKYWKGKVGRARSFPLMTALRPLFFSRSRRA